MFLVQLIQPLRQPVEDQLCQEDLEALRQDRRIALDDLRSALVMGEYHSSRWQMETDAVATAVACDRDLAVWKQLTLGSAVGRKNRRPYIV